MILSPVKYWVYINYHSLLIVSILSINFFFIHLGFFGGVEKYHMYRQKYIYMYICAEYFGPVLTEHVIMTIKKNAELILQYIFPLIGLKVHSVL